ncbi:ubiquinol-cytochrome C reductase [Aulographum hederae CBS 113979]|uniref:Complex III subunit 9 n=1 Tax=Aulographum hederae CBS 113979 TaxID=1176131 RepID=A0A6G1GY64_9PEZI|nr:ubiquinol-cytochrome C reductase [Aulographum hederae CBS 113979]
MASPIYNLFFRKNTAMLTTVFVTMFGFQMAFDTGSTVLWDKINQGRQWKDIKSRYMEKEDEE